MSKPKNREPPDKDSSALSTGGSVEIPKPCPTDVDESSTVSKHVQWKDTVEVRQFNRYAPLAEEGSVASEDEEGSVASEDDLDQDPSDADIDFYLEECSPAGSPIKQIYQVIVNTVQGPFLHKLPWCQSLDSGQDIDCHAPDGFIDVICLYCPGIQATIISPAYIAKQLRMDNTFETKTFSKGVFSISFAPMDSSQPEYHIQGNVHCGLMYTYPLILPNGRHPKPQKCSDCCVTKVHLIQLSASQLRALSDSTGEDLHDVAALDATTQAHVIHQRLGHMGFRRIHDLGGQAKGIPEIILPDPSLYKCPVCDKAKSKKKAVSKETFRPRPAKPGYGAHMDFGFIGMETENSDRNLEIVGWNGETAYLIVVDAATDEWTIYCKQSKEPPLTSIQDWCDRNSPDAKELRQNDAWFRMDQGGELGRSPEVRKLLEKRGYHPEVTGAFSSALNGKAERPNQELANGIRAMMHGAGMEEGAFWPYAAKYYTRQRNAIKRAERNAELVANGEQPLPQGEDLSAFRTFGCRVTVREHAHRNHTLDDNAKTGTFLGFLPRTTDIIHWYDPNRNQVKIGYHATYDEGMLDAPNPPPNVQILCNLRKYGNPVTKQASEKEPLPLFTRDTPFTTVEEKVVKVACDHPTFGLEVSRCPIMLRSYISFVDPGSSAAASRGKRKGKPKKSRLIGKYILTVDDVETFSVDEVERQLAAARESSRPTVKLRLGVMLIFTAKDKTWSDNLDLDPDQVHSIQQIRTYLSSKDSDGKDREFQIVFDDLVDDDDEDTMVDTEPSSETSDETIRVQNPSLFSSLAVDAMTVGYMTSSTFHDYSPGGSLRINALTSSHLTEEEKQLPRFTRERLKKLSNWDTWREGTFKQLDKFYDGLMIGDMVDLPYEDEKNRKALILRPIWQFLVKPTGERKARLCGNGSKSQVPWLHE